MSDQQDSDAVFNGIMEREMFIELIANGISPINAGVQLGWSPRQTRKYMTEPDFQELCAAALERADASIEETLYEVAKRGNMSAIAMWLYNRQPDRWRDVKRIEVKNEVQVSLGVVESVKRGALELLREQGVGAMQALDAPVIDAEVIE